MTVSKSSAVLNTLLTRDMTANMAASVITVVSMSALERLVAISCPWVGGEQKKMNLFVFLREHITSCISGVFEVPGRRERTLPR